MDLKGSKTEKNLQEAFAGESKARNRYTYFSSQAKKNGYVQISRIFEETANNEKEHAKIWYKLLNDGEIKDTLTNLKDAASVEHYEWTDMYKRFSEEAKEEGFSNIAQLFANVAKIEKMHEERYKILYENIANKTVFVRSKSTVWECAKCGFTVNGTEAPEKCPVCGHSKAFFFQKAYNY